MPTTTAAVPARTRRRLGGVAAVLALTTMAAAGFGPAVGAAPIDDKHKQAAALQDQIDASDLQISALAEKLAEADARRDEATNRVADAEAQITQSAQEVQLILGIVYENAASLYRSHSSGSRTTSLAEGNASDLVSRDRYAQAQADRDHQLMDQLRAAQEDLHIRRTDAARARDEAASESDQINAAKTALEKARADQRALLSKVNGEIAAAVAAERARRAAAAQAKFSKPGVPAPDVGPPNGSASQAIAYARAVLGAGYSTNPRKGPTYDCSGLTWSSWHAAGVDIPNTSGQQYAGLPKLPLAAVQPGDLIFWGPNGSSHVALYVGGGMIIDASSGAGQVVERAIFGNPEPLAARVV